MAREIHRDLQVLDQLQDPFIRRSLKTAFHLRRYAPLYVAALAGLLVLGVFPSVQDDGGNNEASVAAGANAAGDTTGGTGAGPGIDGTDSTIAGVPVGRGGARVAPVAAKNLQQSLAAAQQTTGKTRGGIDCKPGVRQLPTSSYAAPCTNAFSGNNGGATSPGVTGDKIIIVRRDFPDTANSQAVDAVVNQAGGAPKEEVAKIRDVFEKYFDGIFELYGRKIEWIDYESQNGNATDEALSQGREGACADATYIKDTLHAFAVFPQTPLESNSAVFSECAAERGMMTFSAAPYYPESWYRRFHPYAWGGVMECERISYQIAEYIGKRLLNRKAKWSGDPITQNTTRKFGTYIPDNDQYQHCGNITKRELETKYGAPKGSPQYNYALDVSRFPDQAAQAIVQFKAAGVTTIVLACDPISTIFLTQAAARQAYYPEWLQIGTALHDVDNAARLFDPTEVDGHLFGPSQLGSTPKLLGTKSEPYILYKKLTGKNLDEHGATDGYYWGLVGFYSALQAAGPLLTPSTVAEGIFSLPPGGAPDYAVGYVSFQDFSDGTPGGRDHTGIDDAREIYWKGTDTSDYDGKTGTYRETYGGKRFRNGQWPAEEPPIYP